MKKTIIAVFALLALLILGWFGVYQMKAPQIEADIEQRVEEALASNSLMWVSFNVDGRDVSLSGTAKNQTMAQHAFDTADIYGLNSLTSYIVVNEASESFADQTISTVSEDTAQATDVSIQEISSKGVAALPYAMQISKNATGTFMFNGVVPDVEFKRSIDEHITSLGGAPDEAVWQVELSSASPPNNWQQNITTGVSALQVLNEGEMTFDNNQAVLKGIAASQDSSEAAKVFAQAIAADFTTQMNVEIAESSVSDSGVVSEEVPLVGSGQYAAKLCQTEFNALLQEQKIVFESGSSNLQKQSTLLLDKIAKVSVRCPNQMIQVHGYTDSRGAASANWRLSKLRAESVANYLVKQGIDKARLTAVGHGEKNPIASNKTEAGRAKNRRIAFIVKGVNK